jgi:hypothetical protein
MVEGRVVLVGYVAIFGEFFKKMQIKMRGHLKPNPVAKRNFSHSLMLPKTQPNTTTGLPCVAKSPAAKNCLVAVCLGIPVIFSQCLYVIFTWGHVPLGVPGVLLLC